MPQKRHKRKRRRSGRYGRYFLLALIALLLISGGTAAAKYLKQMEDERVARAKHFYFTSDLLSEEPVNYILSSKADSISFTLNNHEDQLRTSEDDINYTVTYKEDDGEWAPLQTGTLAGDPDQNHDSLSSVTITLPGLKAGKTYTVKAVGNAGYSQTLSASFKLSDDQKGIYKYLDTSTISSSYVTLTVWAIDIEGDVNIKFRAGLIPDNTIPVMAGVDNYDSVNDKYNAGEFVDDDNFNGTSPSYDYIFFIDDDENLDINEFEITMDATDGNGYIASPADPI